MHFSNELKTPCDVSSPVLTCLVAPSGGVVVRLVLNVRYFDSEMSEKTERSIKKSYKYCFVKTRVRYELHFFTIYIFPRLWFKHNLLEFVFVESPALSEATVTQWRSQWP